MCLKIPLVNECKADRPTDCSQCLGQLGLAGVVWRWVTSFLVEMPWLPWNILERINRSLCLRYKLLLEFWVPEWKLFPSWLRNEVPEARRQRRKQMLQMPRAQGTPQGWQGQAEKQWIWLQSHRVAGVVNENYLPWTCHWDRTRYWVLSINSITWYL